ncbi:MAG: ABC transporter permease [Candidatus Riflebacteria bacterium]|nr:ABC transporter permease [Candidatus Riflebacteria bacterium]
MLELLKSAKRESFRRKERTFANIAGHFFAVALLVILANMLTVSAKSKNIILNNLGTHFLVYVPEGIESSPVASTTKIPLKPLEEGFFSDPSRTKLLPLNILEKIKKIPEIKDASGFLLFKIKSPQIGFTFLIGGFDPASVISVSGNSIQKSDIISGEFLLSNDRGLVLLEESFAVSTGLKPGSSINLAGKDFIVKGILRPGIRPAKAGVYLTFADAENVISNRLTAPLASEANIILVEASSAETHNIAMDEVKKILPGCVIDTYNCFVQASKVMGADEKTLWLLVAIVFITAMLFSMKSQMALLVERRRDIGILRAIGWTDANIISQILAESLLQSLTGGISGCLSALFIILMPFEFVINFNAGWNSDVTPIILIAGFCMTCISGVVSGGIPVMLAIREPPADMLRKF